MKRIVWVYGVIAGLIAGGFMFGMINLADHDSMENGMFYGYASMILAFSMIFVAVKNYRDKHLGGTISFGKAFRIGLFISLIASTIYVLTWEISFNFFVPEYMDKYTAKEVEKLRAGQGTNTEIETKIAEMNSFSNLYKNNFFVRILFSYLEILPVGLLISLIVAVILKRKTAPVQTVTASA